MKAIAKGINKINRKNMPANTEIDNNNLNYEALLRGEKLKSAENNPIQSDNNQSEEGNLKQEKHRARRMSTGMEQLGDKLNDKVDKREKEGKKGGGLTRSGAKAMHKGSKALDVVAKGQEAIDKVKDIPGKASRMGSARMLQSAWLTTFSVIGFLPGLLWVNIHAFGHLIFPKMVCALGEEWTAGTEKKLGEGGKMMNYGLKWGEGMLLVILDLFLLLIIVAALVIIVVITNSFEVTVSLIINAIKSFINSFFE
ncbi:MAG: hypothetical protein KAR44_15040 [Candidatus Aegiribacteria sp.]|nr:hypothetical protein [Candidatus Aegiribacteria sp.]